MQRSRQLGLFIMIGSSVAMLIMLVGFLRRSYLIIALPVVAGVGVITALAFWVGWTMANTEPELAELEREESIAVPV